MTKTGGIKILLIIFLLQFFSLSILFFSSNEVNASEVKFNPQISIPDSEFTHSNEKDGGVTVSKSTETMAKYIKAIYQYGIGIVGILAAVVLMFGGLLWMTAGGDAGRVTEAKEWIKASILGLIIALASYTILQTINPDLVNFRPIEVAPVKPVITDKSGTNANENSNGLEDYDSYAAGLFRRLVDESDYKLTNAIIGNGEEFFEEVNKTNSKYEPFTMPDNAILSNVYRNTEIDHVYSFYSDVGSDGESFIGVSEWIKK